MKFGEVISKAAAANNLKKKDLAAALSSVFADIGAALKAEDKVSVPQLGRFVKKTTKEGAGRILFRMAGDIPAGKAKAAGKKK